MWTQKARSIVVNVSLTPCSRSGSQVIPGEAYVKGIPKQKLQAAGRAPENMDTGSVTYNFPDGPSDHKL
jgi:hypothetical protein